MLPTHSGDVEQVPTLSQNAEIAAEEKGNAGSTSGASAEAHDGKYALSDRDIETGAQYASTPMMTQAEKERLALEEEIGAPVRQVSPYGAHVRSFFHSRAIGYARDLLLICLALGIFIPAMLRPQNEHKRVPAGIITMLAISFILVHKSRYIPQRPFIMAFKYVMGHVEKGWYSLPYYGRLVIGWGSLIVLYLGTAFGIKQNDVSTYERRGIALVGIFLTYCFFYAISTNRSAVQARTTIVGLGFQMIIGLLVYKTQAFFDLFGWLANAAADLLLQGQIGGAAFFWSPDFLDNHFFFVNTLASIIFFVALATALFYIGVLGYVIRKMAVFMKALFGISGAEAVVAAASPIIGQGENCVLTRPFVPYFTDSEFHQVLVSGFATIAGSVFIAYVSLGIDGRNLLLSAFMSIPGSIAASKLVVPETQRPKTLGKVVIVQSDDETKSVDILHALSNGAWFGLRVAGLIFCNVLVIVSVVYTVNGILSWIGQYWGLGAADSHPLTLQLIGSYIFWPFVFLLGTPPADCLKVARLFSTKIVANEFVAYTELATALKADPNYLSAHSQRIATLLLCGFGNLSSSGINIGILTAMAPKRADTIIRLTPRALLCGVLVTSMTAAIGGIIA